jgi:hypothetical protein
MALLGDNLDPVPYNPDRELVDRVRLLLDQSREIIERTRLLIQESEQLLERQQKIHRKAIAEIQPSELKVASES